LIHIASVTDSDPVHRSLEKPTDTVGEPKSTEMGVSHMPSLKAKKLGKLPKKKDF
jgi:hypothetical protein